jgi:hypothetical protein
VMTLALSDDAKKSTAIRRLWNMSPKRTPLKR